MHGLLVHETTQRYVRRRVNHSLASNVEMRDFVSHAPCHLVSHAMVICSCNTGSVRYFHHQNAQKLCEDRAMQKRATCNECLPTSKHPS